MPISHSASHSDAYAAPALTAPGKGIGRTTIELVSPEQIPTLLARTRQRIFTAQFNGRRVWIKAATVAHSNLRYRLLDLVAALSGTPALSAVPAPGGELGIALERARLQALQHHGVRVPQVLAHGAHWLCLSDLGRTPLLAAIQRAPDSAARLSLWTQGLHAIVRTHEHGACLSQCFARNMIVGDAPGEIGFVDFEDDPMAVMSLTHAQARDWALYLFSTVFWLAADAPAELQQRFAAALADEAPGVQHETTELLRRMRWLARLPRHPRWGRDVRLAQAAGRFAQTMIGERRQAASMR